MKVKGITQSCFLNAKILTCQAGYAHWYNSGMTIVGQPTTC